MQQYKEAANSNIWVVCSHLRVRSNDKVESKLRTRHKWEFDIAALFMERHVTTPKGRGESLLRGAERYDSMVERS